MKSACLLVASMLVQSLINVVDASSPMTAAEQLVLVDIHNKLRRGEGSSNMQIMVWDDTLAVIAQNWSDGCSMEHGQAINSSTLNSIGLGQNLWAGAGASITMNLTAAVMSWFNEKENLVFDTVTCTAGKVCGHYTQVVWATSNRVGCGYTACPFLKKVNWTNAIMFTCNYAPAGNYIGAPPYRKGPACTQCHSGQFHCNNGLCDKSCTGPSDTCKCEAACKNCGNITDACRCQCGVGWWGVDCSKTCANTDAQCGASPGWPNYWCDNAHEYVLDKCPVLCNECVAGTPGECISQQNAAGSTASLVSAVLLQVLAALLGALFITAIVV